MCLAHLLLCGLGVAADLEAALALLRLSAADDNADAQLALGLCYLRGDGTKRDRLQAEELLDKPQEVMDPADWADFQAS